MALSASVTATGDVTAGAASVLAVQVRASAAATVVVPIPGGGILFAARVHATLTNADGLTVVYQ